MTDLRVHDPDPGVHHPPIQVFTIDRNAQHIALATLAEVDVLVSWNFRHIVRLDKIRLFNAVNLELGYKPLSIYSPREVTFYGEE